jgi:dihydroxyacetone kinase-like predicted kinase
MLQTATYPLSEIDGRNLYYAFIAGAKKIIEHQTELNKINVFPVNDGDTGSNLAGTVRSVLETIHPDRSYKVTAGRIAEASIINARGNSGIIFAQFFYGLSRETEEVKSINLSQFAEALKRSVRYVYEAVAKPVEGTMLTVIRELADFIYSSRNKFSDFNHLFISSYEVLTKSLLETRTKLEVLEKNKVVDAGAKGFVLFFEGIRDFINLRNIKELVSARSAVYSFSREEDLITENITFRYCTEAILKESPLTNSELMSILERYGDSVVVAGSDKVKRLHLHTNNPSELFHYSGTKGPLLSRKLTTWYVIIRSLKTGNGILPW